MTVSNVHTFTLNRDEIITEAVELTGTADLGNALYPEELEAFARTLNLFFKAWQPKGLFLHTYKPATLFLTGQQSYLLGPTGDHATESYVESELTADAATSATVLTLAETGINVSDYIGVELDSGDLHWTTVASLAPLTLTTGITGAAATGNKVYTYTTKIIRPIKIKDVMFLDDDSERPVNQVSLSEYKNIPSKDSTGQAVQCAYDPQLDNSRLYVWPVSNTATEKLNFVYQKPVDDFTTDSDTATGSADWLHCLTIGLAYHISPKRNLPIAVQAGLKARYEQALADLDDFEETSIFFCPR